MKKTETTHTPGPWKVWGKDTEKHGWREIVVGDYTGDNPVAITSPFNPDLPSAVKEAEANARLIAAAPVMRDALVEARKALNTVFGHRCFTEGQQQQIGEALEFVIKAIEDTKLFSERERLGG